MHLWKTVCDTIYVLLYKFNISMNGGIVVVAIGVLFLLKNIGVLEGIDWGILWPLAVIAIGLNMFFKKRP